MCELYIVNQLELSCPKRGVQSSPSMDVPGLESLRLASRTQASVNPEQPPTGGNFLNKGHLSVPLRTWVLISTLKLERVADNIYKIMHIRCSGVRCMKVSPSSSSVSFQAALGLAGGLKSLGGPYAKIVSEELYKILSRSAIWVFSIEYVEFFVVKNKRKSKNFIIINLLQ